MLCPISSPVAGLRWLRNVTIEGVYYGAAEMLAVPVVDLSICTQYADITTALATFELIGSHRALAPFFPEACDDLDKSGFLEEINQFTRARETAEKAGANLTPGQDGDPFLQEISKQLSVTLQWAVKERSVSTASRMLQRARFCFGRRDYMRASFLALEAIILHGVRQKKPDHSPSQYSEKLRAKAQRWLLSNLSGEDKERFRLLRDLRNAIGHGSKGGFPRVKDAVKDEGRMETLLKELLDQGAVPVGDPGQLGHHLVPQAGREKIDQGGADQQDGDERSEQGPAQDHAPGALILLLQADLTGPGFPVPEAS